jgi:altronate hydrolase
MSIPLYDNLGEVNLAQAAIHLHPDDDVVIARTSLTAGTIIHQGENTIKLPRTIPGGHKIALKPVASGEPVHRYGQIIGFATEAIAVGDHVHTHNLSANAFERQYEPGKSVSLVDFVAEPQTFMGYQRTDGRVGTRNYIAVIPTVNCSSHTSRQIAAAFTPDILANYPNIDGVIAFPHFSGCANRINGPDYLILQRTLAGIARHANVGAYIIVGLGCETNQIADLISNHELGEVPALTIQEAGGIRKTVKAGIEAVQSLLPQVNQTARTPQPISEIMVALQCGGSDSWSGVTANPALGFAVNELIRHGGSAVLAETPEIYGAEHLLIHRATSQAVADRLIEKIHWWEEHTRRLNIEIDNNPSVGNKLGGLTTIYEKSLGAVAKGGSTPLNGVFDYAEAVNVRGLSFMDSPGYDPVAVTGQVAGGSNIVVFTTGRGSVFGFRPAPSIKVSTNTPMYDHMRDDMDINAGAIVDGEPMQDVATEILEMIVAVASGQQTRSEAQGIGESEFTPWNLGGTL